MIKRETIFVATLGISLFLLTCSDAPLIELSANRIVLAELFSATD
jgi:hypothetical protein